MAVVILTGQMEESLGLEAVHKGAQDFLAKGSINGPVIARAIRYAVDRKRAQNEIQLLNKTLEHRVQERTAQLTAANESLVKEKEESMPAHTPGRTAEILMVEDDPGDVELTREFLKIGKLCNNLHVVPDGVEALAFLRREGKYASVPRPDLILLDLNLPKKSGHEVLAEIKADEELRVIPVVIMTTSKTHEDVLKSYQLNANCYITKPVTLDGLLEVVRALESFGLSVVILAAGE